MSVKLKPCPCCNGQAEMGYGDGCYFVYCTHCNVCGAGEVDFGAGAEEQAAEAWNALPRRLQWTTEPPTEPGFYWHRDDGMLSIEYVYASAGALFCHFAGEEDATLLDLVTGEWAGPIPEPQEPK